MPEPSENNDLQLKIEKEKTRRELIKYVLIGLGVLLLAYFFLKDPPVKGQTKKFKVTKDGIEIGTSLIDQAVEKKDVSTVDYKSGDSDVKVAVGDVSRSFMQELRDQNVAISPDKFTGNNYINDVDGYIIPVYDAKQYSIDYNPNWRSDETGMAHISQIMANDGGVVEARMSIDNVGMNIQTATETILAPVITLVAGRTPEIKYDSPNHTSFMSVYVQANNKNVVFKIVKRGNRFFVFNARYDPGSPYESVLLQMVADASLIER